MQRHSLRRVQRGIAEPFAPVEALRRNFTNEVMARFEVRPENLFRRRFRKASACPDDCDGLAAPHGERWCRRGCRAGFSRFGTSGLQRTIRGQVSSYRGNRGMGKEDGRIDLRGKMLRQASRQLGQVKRVAAKTDEVLLDIEGLRGHVQNFPDQAGYFELHMFR